jgi:5-(carboxyamino)imidazole ribonucleotide synthase
MSDITLGIIGSGQLGSMLCQAAKKLNVKTVVISDDEQGPAQSYCDQFIFSKYDDQTKIKDFINKVDVVTFEFENIPVDILKNIDKVKKVYPKPDINKIIQNRKLEKTLVNDLDIKTTEWAFIKTAEDVAKNEKLLPGILKTNTLGYDGHGQFFLNSLNDIKKDWCFTADYILEKKVDLKKEISVILTRFQNGAITIYAPIENVHENQILKHSKIPAEINDKISSEALQSAKKIAEHLEYVGTMTVEYFINQNNDLLVNEIAPRVHNSGHLTINAFNVSQFEGHVRAVCDLEIITPDKIFNSAEMINILGKEIEEYRSKTFNEGEFFFDYGKKEIKDKRKMGHLTILKK